MKLETISGTGLEGPMRLFLILGEERRELTTEEALSLAQKLLELATEKASQEGAFARQEIAALLSG